MSVENREAAIKATLKWEGGYTNNPSDPGGPTNWGITIADAKRYWKSNATAADVKAMPQSVAVDIYRNKYWKTSYYDCDKLDSGVDLAVFDFGVNSGPSRAKRYLLLSIGGTSEETINNLFDKRLEFLRSLKTWPTFGAGWSHRCDDLRKVSLNLARQKTPIINGKTAGIATLITGLGLALANWWNQVVNFFHNLF